MRIDDGHREVYSNVSDSITNASIRRALEIVRDDIRNVMADDEVEDIKRCIDGLLRVFDSGEEGVIRDGVVVTEDYRGGGFSTIGIKVEDSSDLIIGDPVLIYQPSDPVLIYQPKEIHSEIEWVKQ